MIRLHGKPAPDRLTCLPIALAWRTTRSAISDGITRFTLKQILRNRRERLFPGSYEPILRGIVERILQHALALSPAFQWLLAQPHCGLLDAFNRRDDVAVPKLRLDFAQIEDAVGRPGLRDEGSGAHGEFVRHRYDFPFVIERLRAQLHDLF